MIPKPTLQPIIENAIIHGLEGQVGPGQVSVDIATDGSRLLIDVDDGIGMSEEVLEEVSVGGWCLRRLRPAETSIAVECSRERTTGSSVLWRAVRTVCPASKAWAPRSKSSCPKRRADV